MNRFEVDFPTLDKFSQIYWDIHAKFNYNIFKSQENVELRDDPSLQHTSFGYEVRVDGKLILFDYFDRPEIPQYPSQKYHCIFKTHLHENKETFGIFPWSPVSFYEWRCFEDLSSSMIYDAFSQTFNMSQNIYGNAIERRKKARNIMLSSGFGVDTGFGSQSEWFMKFRSQKAFIAVPGFDEHIMDRGVTQAMLLGFPVICPEIKELLPGNIRMIPGEDYVKVLPDFSDLLEVLRNLPDLDVIQKSAKKKALSSLTNKALFEWLLRCLLYQS